MDLKKTDEFLKNKLQQVKDEKSRTEWMAVISLLGQNLVDSITSALKDIKISPPPMSVNVPSLVVPEIKIPELPKFPEFPAFPAFPAYPAFPEVKIPEINIPEIKLPTINVPEPKVTVNVPKADAPIVNVPAPIVNFPDSMRLTPNTKPFPVTMVDMVGKPMQFPQSAGGGRADFFTIKDIQTSTGASIISDQENAIRITGTVTTSGTVGSTASALIDSGGVQYSGSNPLPVTATISGITNSIQVVQLDRDGNPWQPETFGPGDAATAMRVILAGNSDASVVINSGTLTTVTTLTGITNSVASATIDSSGVQYSGSNPFPVTLAVTNATTTMNVALTDSGGVQYSGSNPVPITGTVTVGTVTNTVAIVGDVGVGVADTNSPPVKGGGKVNLTNPTKYADGTVGTQMLDQIGRPVVTPFQVRGLLKTAFISLVAGSGVNTETTIAAGAAGEYLDLVYISASTTSLFVADSTVSPTAQGSILIDIRASTGGGIITNLSIPPADRGGTAIFAPTIPWPQADVNAAWTVKASNQDLSGTDITLTALFARNT